MRYFGSVHHRLIVAATLAVGFMTSIAWAADGDAVVLVNGHPISRRALVDTLMESHGLQIMQQLIVLELAKQETRARGLRVSAGEIDREFASALREIAPEVNATGAILTDDEKRQALDYLLQEKGLSLTEFMLAMERNAHLRKIVEADLQIDEATLREEFARIHGEKAEVRSIQLDSVDALHEASNLLGKGIPFAEVARRVSQDRESASRGGLIEPFSFRDENVAPILREAVFALEPGERTKPLKVGRWWFIMQLEQRIPPENVRFESVRKDVERELRNRVVPQRMNEIVLELFAKAEIKVLDRDLKRKFESLLERNAIVTQPGG